MFIEPSTAIKLAEPIVTKFGANWIAWGRDIFRVAIKGRMNIFIVGCAGTGKTSLKQFLITRDDTKVPAAHSSTTTRERDRGDKVEAFSHLYDYPGQTDDFMREFQADAGIFQAAGRTIVLMCTSYGYHSDWGQSAGIIAKPEALAPSTTTMAAALEDSKVAELKFLDKFFESYVRGVTGRLDMMTIVLKQDLWFDELNEVVAFYGGEYAQIIQSKYNHTLGTHRFRHDIFGCSLRRENFTSTINNNTEQKQSLAGYTTTMQDAYRKIFFSNLERWVKRTQG
jgi:hypothetical protein